LDSTDSISILLFSLFWQVHQRSRNIIQSSKKRCPFSESSSISLPSANQLRISFQRILARYFKIWKTLVLFWVHKNSSKNVPERFILLSIGFGFFDQKFIEPLVQFLLLAYNLVQLFQEAQGSSKISKCNLRHYWDRIFCSLSKIGQIVTPECSQSTQRVYIQKDPGSYRPED